MKKVLLRGFLITLACCAFSAAAWYFINIYAMVISLPIFGIALSRVIIDFVAEMRISARDAALAHLDGVYFSYRGTGLQVLEDEEHCRWVPTNEVRRIVGSAAPDRLLALTYPTGFSAMGEPEQGHLRDDALMAYLAKEPSMPAIKFKNWAERNIAFPARKQRERLGIRLAEPTAKELA